MRATASGKTVELPTNVDAELLAKVLSNPEMAALLSALILAALLGNKKEEACSG